MQSKTYTHKLLVFVYLAQFSTETRNFPNSYKHALNNFSVSCNSEERSKQTYGVNICNYKNVQRLVIVIQNVQTRYCHT